jgi:ATP-dependent helicase HrpB
LCQGGQATLSPSSVALEPVWLLAIEADVRKGVERTGAVVITRASAIEPDWLLDQFPDELHEQREYVLTGERVERIEKLSYMSLAIMESRDLPTLADAREVEAVAQLLADELRRRGPGKAFDMERVTQLFERLRFLSEVDHTLPAITAANASEWILADALELCRGKSAFAALTTEEIIEVELGKLPTGMRAQLDRLAPTELKLPSGRRLAVKYAAGQPPFAESRLQDFFGMTDSPKVAGGKVPIVLHLLAPNHRAVQVTSDLRGFWTRTYAEVRKELGRRYPRHHWPDDPLNPGPPPTKRR